MKTIISSALRLLQTPRLVRRQEWPDTLAVPWVVRWMSSASSSTTYPPRRYHVNCSTLRRPYSR